MNIDKAIYNRDICWIDRYIYECNNHFIFSSYKEKVRLFNLKIKAFAKIELYGKR
jgi:hypothetical protein